MDWAVPLLEDRLKQAGLHARSTSRLAVLEFYWDPDRAVSAIGGPGEQAVTQDKVEVGVLGCANVPASASWTASPPH